MNRSSAVAIAAVLLIARPTQGRDARPISVAAGAVMSLINEPYATVGVARDGWLFRVSGGVAERDCHGVQLNAAHVVEDRAMPGTRSAPQQTTSPSNTPVLQCAP